jgi:hypothetical protein
MSSSSEKLDEPAADISGNARGHVLIGADDRHDIQVNVATKSAAAADIATALTNRAARQAHRPRTLRSTQEPTICRHLSVGRPIDVAAADEFDPSA